MFEMIINSFIQFSCSWLTIQSWNLKAKRHMHELRAYFYSFVNTSLYHRLSSSVMDTAKMKPLTKANRKLFIQLKYCRPFYKLIIFLFSFEDEHFAHCYQLWTFDARSQTSDTSLLCSSFHSDASKLTLDGLFWGDSRKTNISLKILIEKKA